MGSRYGDAMMINGVQTKRAFKYRGSNYVASRVIAHDHGDWETMIFPADDEGKITSYGELYAITGYEDLGESISKFKKGWR